MQPVGISRPFSVANSPPSAPLLKRYGRIQIGCIPFRQRPVTMKVGGEQLRLRSHCPKSPPIRSLMPPLRLVLLVGLLGAAGAIGRLALSEFVYRLLGRGFPLGTLAVNVLGCFLMGGLAQLGLASNAVPELWRAALAAGFLGGLTTFSTFGYETMTHLQEGHWGTATGNIVLSISLGLAAVWAGIAVTKLVVG